MKKRFLFSIIGGSLLAGAFVVIGWLALMNFGDNKRIDGFNDGIVQGRREVIDAILINVANEGNVVIRQGDQSLTLILEKPGEEITE